MEQQEQANSSQESHAAEKPETVSRFRVFDLAASATFRSEGPTVRVLWESATGRLLLLALQEGQQLDEHRTSSQAFIQVISGHLIFTLEHERISMRAGTLLHLEPRVAHSVEALQDSVFLITLIGAGLSTAAASEAAEPASEPQRAPKGGED
ncbi:cupin domain-containing protein [Thermogemmatispora carboxidivorans]|uniref:cupin domain-containing protein n=1 Tax=Thermogemmatispora carboxidivorans TaxID=1382306 RepID=UPI00069B7847|nr:cupin domain-containing protein [Thermogemmatispora carboxidivorans]